MSGLRQEEESGVLSAFIWETELVGGNDVTSGHVDFETL